MALNNFDAFRQAFRVANILFIAEYYVYPDAIPYFLGNEYSTASDKIFITLCGYLLILFAAYFNAVRTSRKPAPPEHLSFKDQAVAFFSEDGKISQEKITRTVLLELFVYFIAVVIAFIIKVLGRGMF